jgi:hypothetical protein
LQRGEMVLLAFRDALGTVASARVARSLTIGTGFRALLMGRAVRRVVGRAVRWRSGGGASRCSSAPAAGGRTTFLVLHRVFGGLRAGAHRPPEAAATFLLGGRVQGERDRDDGGEKQQATSGSARH